MASTDPGPPSFERKGWFLYVLTCACILGVPEQTAAQVVTGSVVDRERGSAIPEALVEVLDDSLRLVSSRTNALGGFQLRLPRDGRYVIRVSALGYQQLQSDGFDAHAGDSLRFRVELSPVALELPGLIVNLRHEQRGRDRFRRRMETHEGVFLGPEDLALKEMWHPGDAFHGLEEQGVRLYWRRGSVSQESSWMGRFPLIEGGSTRCLKFFLNEQPVYRGQPGTGARAQWTYYPLNLLQPDDIRGIEIYRGPGEVPRAFRARANLPVSVAEAGRSGPRSRAGGGSLTQRLRESRFGGDPPSPEEVACGVVIIWTKGSW